MSIVYCAKSADESDGRITNQEHMTAAAQLAQRFGAEVSMPKRARVAGLLHDFGKCSEAFQNVLNGTAANIDHAICAAVFLYCSGITHKFPDYRPVAAAVAAHHSSLRDFKDMEPELKDIFLGKGTGFCRGGKKRL